MIPTEVQTALSQIKQSHGKPINMFTQKRIYGELNSEKVWDKTHEFKVWVEQAKTGEVSWFRQPLTKLQWKEIDDFALKSMKIKKPILEQSKKYRELFDACIAQKKEELGDEFIKIYESGGYSISSGPLHECSHKSALNSGLLTKDNLKEIYPYLKESTVGD